MATSTAMNVESKLWKVESFNDGVVCIIQKASRQMRVVSRGVVPDVPVLAAMREIAFDRTCRYAFHGWR